MAGGPEEAVIAYEANRNDCDDEVKRRGYSDWGHGANLFLSGAQQDKINEANDYRSALAFPPAHTRLLLYRGAPFMFMTWWGGEGRIGVFQVISLPSGGEPYGRKEVCQIGFKLPPAIAEMMTK